MNIVFILQLVLWHIFLEHHPSAISLTHILSAPSSIAGHRHSGIYNFSPVPDKKILDWLGLVRYRTCPSIVSFFIPAPDWSDAGQSGIPAYINTNTNTHTNTHSHTHTHLWCAAWTWTGTWTFNMDMKHGHGHAPWTWRWISTMDAGMAECR
jgi:hypothetical protein